MQRCAEVVLVINVGQYESRRNFASVQCAWEQSSIGTAVVKPQIMALCHTSGDCQVDAPPSVCALVHNSLEAHTD